MTGYIEAELDRRHPGLPLLRSDDPDDCPPCGGVEGIAAETVDRARSLPPAARRAGRRGVVVPRDAPAPRVRHRPVDHRSGPGRTASLPPARPAQRSARRGADRHVDLDASPTLDEVLAVRRGRMDRVADLRVVDAAGLPRQVASPNGGTVTVLNCLHVVLREEWSHDRYANRDLSVLEATW